MSRPDVVIVGAGLAGLCCALHIRAQGYAVLVLEASDGVGGRVRSDYREGFILDRGFQVLLTAYPEARRMLDYEALDLCYFAPGALVYFGGRFHKLVDPWRRPLDSPFALFSPIGSMSDKFRVARLRSKTLAGSVSDLFKRPETTACEALRNYGFSSTMIERFFRPFLGGIFFDHDLAVSSRMFEFGFRMFSAGDTALPAGGMGSIPEQLATRLPAGTIRTHAEVKMITDTGVSLVSGESLEACSVVIATDAPRAAALLGEPQRSASRSMTCMYFAFDTPPVKEPFLVLNGEGDGPVNSLTVPTLVTPSYAPAGTSLIAATIIGIPHESDDTLESAVRRQLAGWFGRVVYDWQHIRTYRIRHALPAQTAPTANPESPPVNIRPGLFLCGEHRNVASIQWAMVSGRRAAEAVVHELSAG